jgi:hypothetical protein
MHGLTIVVRLESKKAAVDSADNMGYPLVSTDEPREWGR